MWRRNEVDVRRSTLGNPTPATWQRRRALPSASSTSPPSSKPQPYPDRALYPREQPISEVEHFAPIELAEPVQRHLQRIEYEGPTPLAGRVFRITEWDRWNMPQRLAFLRAFVEDTSRDPAIAAKAVEIIRKARVPLRNHRREWEALLRYVQRNIRFTAEPNERIQSPQYTLTTKFGDCDDLHVALAGLAHSIRLPWRFAISGRDKQGRKRRWVEGSGPCPEDVTWTHIFIGAGWPPFRPNEWAWAEATLDVPLGWDSMKVGTVEGRTDLSGIVGHESAAMGALVNHHVKGWPLVKQHLHKLPWRTILGSVVGGVLTAAAVQIVLKRRK